MHRIDGEGATADGRFTEGNPITGEIPTVVTKGWLNDLQENIMRCLREGVPATKGRDLDLWDAIMAGATKIITDFLQSFEYVQDGGNVTGSIKGGKFRLNAPAGPTIPATLTPSGGNVTGTINVLGGTFTLTAAGGGSGEGPAIPKDVVAIGTGTGIRAAKDGTSDVTWGGNFLGVNDGTVGASGGDGLRCLYGGTRLDGSQPMNFQDCVGLSTSQSPDGGKNWAAGYAGGGALQFKIAHDGVFYGKNAAIQAADYAEWFEGEPDLPPGTSVVIGPQGVRRFDPAHDRPSHIVGVTRPGDTRAALIGNAAESHWAKLYRTDDFGAPIWTEAKDVDGRVYQTQAINPAFDPSRPYVPRSQRPEWSLVGLLGQIPVRVGQTVNPRWRLIAALSDTANLYFVR